MDDEVVYFVLRISDVKLLNNIFTKPKDPLGFVHL